MSGARKSVESSESRHLKATKTQLRGNRMISVYNFQNSPCNRLKITLLHVSMVTFKIVAIFCLEVFV